MGSKIVIIRLSPDELKHHGIKGQHWGIRRYQNEDGSYTTEGLSRYKRGKIYSSEHSKYQKEEFNKRMKNSKKYKEYEHESNRLAEKYGLDRDDGGGGDTSRFDQKTLDRAGTRYWEMQENMSALEDRFHDEASKAAGRRLTEKYGDQALSDMNYHDNAVAANWLIGLGAFTIGVIALSRKK